MNRRLLLFVAFASALSTIAHAQTAAADDSNRVLRELRAGAVVLMRHTQTTPGVGDPPGWRPDDCASQRNLDASGIDHAKRIGRWFAEHKLAVKAVRTSPWCRTRETARLAFGRAEDWPALANLFEDRSGAEAQTAAARRAIDALPSGELVVWVSHGSTIAALIGPEAGGLAPGEFVVVRRAVAAHGAGAAPRVLGRLRVP